MGRGSRITKASPERTRVTSSQPVNDPIASTVVAPVARTRSRRALSTLTMVRPPGTPGAATGATRRARVHRMPALN
ncbi:MAG: hypothetical protein JWL60_574, partial [Gemmatimonadetes bacterium]|nr:hypothetical protein [Gemmatimonadota bacterium]